MNVPIIAPLLIPEGSQDPVLTFRRPPAIRCSTASMPLVSLTPKRQGNRQNLWRKVFYADPRLDLAKVYESSVEIQDRSETARTLRPLKDRYQPFLAVDSFHYDLRIPCSSAKKNQRTITQIAANRALTPAFLLNAALAQDAPLIPRNRRAFKSSQQVRKYNDSLKLAESDKEDFEDNESLSS